MAEPTLIERLGIKRGDVVALVGGGGKSSTLLQLRREADDAGWTVRVGTTTKVGVRQMAAVEDFIHGGENNGKLTGAPVESFTGLAVDLVVVEADGARTLPAKAPASHEPVLPPVTTVLVTVIGADALDRVIEDQCHRPMRVAAVVGCRSYDRLTPERAAVLVNSDRGGRKGLPPGARHVVLVTKVSDDNEPLVQRLVDGLGDTPSVLVSWAEDLYIERSHPRWSPGPHVDVADNHRLRAVTRDRLDRFQP